MDTLPEGFVYVQDVDPTIIENLRYTTDENFVGSPIQGYSQPKAILTKEAAEALHQVQQSLLLVGYSLVIYDAYRPQQAVDHFVAWGEDVKDDKTKAVYYPRMSKYEIFSQKYISEKSSHSRGSTVDVTLIEKDKQIKSTSEIIKETRILLDGLNAVFLHDNTLDMGTSFDLFDPASHPQSNLVDEHYLKNRKLLETHMEAYGFEVYPHEWWHFTLKNEPYPNTYFDFEIK